MPTTPGTLGLDIGGANLKAALATGVARSLPFALWREPAALPARLRVLLDGLPHDALAVTMTGELCDCFATKREGVNAILDAVAAAAPQTPARVWSTEGRLVTLEDARADPWRVASANWHALATSVARLVPDGAGLLIDVGSTTTDMIPLGYGCPAPRGLTDPERLDSHELVYTGVRRTPVCSVLGLGAIPGTEVAAELFATMHDVYLFLGLLPEEPDSLDSADGRPATKACAHARLARMKCSDVEAFSENAAWELAHAAHREQVGRLFLQLCRVCGNLPGIPRRIIVAGSGEFLARQLVEKANFANLGCGVVSLAERIGAAASTAACAFALATLADEQPASQGQ